MGHRRAVVVEPATGVPPARTGGPAVRVAPLTVRGAPTIAEGDLTIDDPVPMVRSDRAATDSGRGQAVETN
ncbi:MAG TPA: hypothetical protein PK428_11105 [Phycicoccus sp.]|nr:hypothetical protein [Phycicoccus sp.]